MLLIDLQLAIQNKCNIYEIDVKFAFLNGYLEEAYVERPLGYVRKVKRRRSTY